MAQKKTIGVRLRGVGMHPGQVSSKRIAKVIKLVENLVVAMMRDIEPELRKDQTAVGLSALEDSSLVMDFEVMNFEDLARDAMGNLGGILRSRKYDQMGPLSRKYLRDIQSLNQLWELDSTEFYMGAGDRRELLGSLFPDNEIPGPIIVTEITDIYGQVVGVGGKTEPKIRLTLLGEERGVLACDASQSLTSEAGKLLYQTIGLRGIAKVDVEASVIESFKAEELLPYREKPLDEAFANLRNAVNGCFDHIDPEEFVAEMRGEDW